MPWIQKTNPRSWGSSITPNFEGFDFPGFEVKRACEVERLGLNRKKRWRDGTAGIADRAIAEPGSTGVPTQVVNTATSSGSQKSLPIAFNHTGERVGSSYQSDRS